MKKILRLSLLAALCAGVISTSYAQTVSSEPRPLDRIVAVVNNDIVTEYELQNRVHQVALNMRRQGIELPQMPILRRQVLERLISEKTIGQRARELGVRVDEQMVNASVEQIARNNHITVEELRSRLAQDGVNFGAFRNQIREDILFQRLRERDVDSKITIPESEIDTYLAEKAGFSGDETTEYQVAHIVIPIVNGNEREAKNQAEDLAKRARKGEDFTKLVTTYSKAENALEGGSLGWRDAGRLPTAFWQALQSNPKQGEVATVRVADSYHVLKILGERNGVKAKLSGAPVEQTHARHILLFASDIMPEGAVISRLNEIRAKVLAKQGDFATYARLNSVDGSATKGGDLGWLQPGDTVPAFEEAMRSLAVGEISEPVKSQYGYHLIQVLDRRTQAADESRSRYAARQALRERKLDEALTTWQRELRDKAYVQIREENL